VADLLGEEFAISGNAPVESVELTVAGINTVEDYGAVQKLLSEINVIESFWIAQVDGDRIRYRVEALGGVERLGRALRFNGLIEQNGFDGSRFPVDALNSSLEFFYNP
jgi:hypothetical protein